MELLQLRYYAAVVEEGSINGAARRLSMTQPPVSMQIRLLEQELGCTLFERGSRKIRLTEEGRILYEHALRILNMTESAAAAVVDCHNADTGTLRIGVVSSVVDTALDRWFTGFARLHPGVNYEITDGNTYLMLDRLKSRALDIAFVRTPFSARGFQSYSLNPEDMLLFASREMTEGLPDPVSLKQAAALPLILYRRWEAVLDRAFAAKGYKPRVICVADDVRTCISWAGAGLGAAIAPADMRDANLPAGLTVRVIRGLTPAAETTVVVNEGGCDTAVGKAFLAWFRADTGL